MATIMKKICLLGDFAVGKTSLVRRFVFNMFDDSYISTIGVKVSRKIVAVPRAGAVTELVIMLWDIAGKNGFEQVRTSYMRGAAGAVLVCDLTRPETLDSLAAYADDLRALNPNANVIIAANKCDLAGYRITAEQIERLASRYHAPYYLTSARMGDAVESMFRHLGRLLLPAD